MAAEAKASTSCAGGGWGKTAAIRENEEKSVRGAITRGAKGSARLKGRKIGGERRRGHGPRKVWWRWPVKKVVFELRLSAETSPEIQGGTEQLTIDERRVPELEVSAGTATLNPYHRSVVVVVVVVVVQKKWYPKSSLVKKSHDNIHDNNSRYVVLA